jgi:hypothetical protein
VLPEGKHTLAARLPARFALELLLGQNARGALERRA